jgi:hypothetical protein
MTALAIPRSMRRTAPGVAAAAAFSIAAAGCGLSDPYRGSGSKTTATTAARSAATVQPAGRTASAPAPSRSPQTVLEQFALAYGDVSLNDLTARERQLGALATPGLASKLAAGAQSAAAEAARGLPAGASMVSAVSSVHVGGRNGMRTRATVVLQQAVELAGGVAQPPVETTYSAKLSHTTAGWRVDYFEVQR